MPKKKPSEDNPRKYVDPRLAKATLILREFLSSFPNSQPDPAKAN